CDFRQAAVPQTEKDFVAIDQRRTPLGQVGGPLPAYAAVGGGKAEDRRMLARAADAAAAIESASDDPRIGVDVQAGLKLPALVTGQGVEAVDAVVAGAEINFAIRH